MCGGRVDSIFVEIGRMNKYVLALKGIFGEEMEKVVRDGKQYVIGVLVPKFLFLSNL